jgi:hypothetical protein
MSAHQPSGITADRDAWRAGHAVPNELVEALRGAVDALDGKVSCLDQQICCNGQECGCRGSTNRCLLIHDARALLVRIDGEQA